MSPPEKVFELFATIKDEDGLFMSYEDFMRAMVPYNYRAKLDEEEKSGEDKVAEKNYNNLMKFADLDGDGKISIYEYFLVGRFLSLKESDLRAFLKEN
jgi:Ca2+-binding EF-hand superfamily protein